MEQAKLAQLCNRTAAITLVALILLCLAWEMWLAPLRPGGSWLVLKTLPLLLPLFGILHGRRYTHQWASMLSLLYFMEGTVRATTENGLPQAMALAEIVLVLAFFGATIGYARLSSRESR